MIFIKGIKLISQRIIAIYLYMGYHIPIYYMHMCDNTHTLYQLYI